MVSFCDCSKVDSFLATLCVRFLVVLFIFGGAVLLSCLDELNACIISLEGGRDQGRDLLLDRHIKGMHNLHSVHST